MCFSVEASFLASFLLALTGVATLNVASSSIYRWIALTPIFFAIQQFNEGILWLYMPDGAETSQIAQIAQWIYMFFAYFFWPLWIPFSLLMAETIPARRTIITLCLGAGIGMTLYFILNFMTYTEPVHAHIIGHSIQYTENDSRWIIIYGAIAVIPCLTSSVHWMKYYGVLILISFIMTDYFYTGAFVSVWCFAAAILSLTLYAILRANKKFIAKTKH